MRGLLRILWQATSFVTNLWLGACLSVWRAPPLERSCPPSSASIDFAHRLFDEPVRVELVGPELGIVSGPAPDPLGTVVEGRCEGRVDDQLHPGGGKRVIALGEGGHRVPQLVGLSLPVPFLEVAGRKLVDDLLDGVAGYVAHGSDPRIHQALDRLRMLLDVARRNEQALRGPWCTENLDSLFPTPAIG